MDTEGQAKYGGTSHNHHIQADVSAVADTGAQSDVWSLSDFLACGFSQKDLIPVSIGLSAANRLPIKIEGAFFAKLSNGDKDSCHSMVYVSSSVQGMYLSYDSLLNLGILSAIYSSSIAPVSETADGTETCDHDPKSAITGKRFINNGCIASNVLDDGSCSCPQRAVTPTRPSQLPFPCIPANNGKMKKWLLDRYAASTFNTCPHRALPSMEGPPIEIHIDPYAPPKVCHTPAPVPLHWQQ